MRIKIFIGTDIQHEKENEENFIAKKKTKILLIYISLIVMKLLLSGRHPEFFLYNVNCETSTFNKTLTHL